MLNMLKLRHVKFNFSNLSHLKLADAIFKTIYDHNDYIKQTPDAFVNNRILNTEEFLKNRKIPRTLLIDDILSKINLMIKENEVSANEA